MVIRYFMPGLQSKRVPILTEGREYTPFCIDAAVISACAFKLNVLLFTVCYCELSA